MGCHQSKVEEQVVNAPPADASVVAEPAPAPATAVESEVTATVDANKSAPTPAKDAAPTQKPATTETDTEPAEEAVDPPQAEQKEEEVEAPAAVTDTEQSIADAPAKEVVEDAAVEEPTSTPEEPTPTPEEPTPTPEEPTPTPEPAPEAIKSTDVEASETQASVSAVTEPVEPLLANAAIQTEPEAEVAPSDEPKQPRYSFESVGVSVGEGHVVYYQYKLVDTEAPQREFVVRKRFNDFKALHTEMAKLMASESNVPASQNDKFKTYPALPALPKAGVSTVLFGRRNKALTAEREAQLGKIMNAIARHPIAYESNAFQGFIA